MPEFIEGKLARIEKEVDQGSDRLADAGRLTRQIQHAGRRMDAMFIRRAVQQPNPTPNLIISEERAVQAGWQNRYQEMLQEVAYLKQATDEVRRQCQIFQTEIERVKRGFEKSRTISVARQTPPRRRDFSFFERILRAFKAGQISVLFERYELIPQPDQESVEYLDKVLAEQLPETKALEDLLAEVMRAKEECQRHADQGSS